MNLPACLRTVLWSFIGIGSHANRSEDLGKVKPLGLLAVAGARRLPMRQRLLWGALGFSHTSRRFRQPQVIAWKILKIMDWLPIVFVTFKVLVLGTGAFFAVRWHYLRAQKDKKMDKRAFVRAGAKVAAVFVLALLGVGLFTLVTSRMLGLDLTLP